MSSGWEATGEVRWSSRWAASTRCVNLLLASNPPCRWGNGVGVPSRGPPPGIRVGRLCHRPLMARPHQLRALLRRLQSGAHGPRLMTQALLQFVPAATRVV